MLWGEQWDCRCGYSNFVLRTKCRGCGSSKPDDASIVGVGEVMRRIEDANLATAIEAKSREIASTGLCRWEYAEPLYFSASHWGIHHVATHG